MSVVIGCSVVNRDVQGLTFIDVGLTGRSEMWGCCARKLKSGYGTRFSGVSLLVAGKAWYMECFYVV